MRANTRVRYLTGAVLALAMGAAGGTLLGCGSKTITVNASTPTSSGTATQQTGTGSTTSASTPTTTATSAVSTPSTTRTATEPAFTEPETGGSQTTAAAAAVVRAHGYTPNDTGEYHAGQTLRVLLGTRTGSSDGYDQRAFFFIDGRYIGTDTKDASATVKIVSQSDTAVTLVYPLYRAGDPLCCPGGGQATVRYELNNGKLVPVGTIPPANSSAGLSRH